MIVYMAHAIDNVGGKQKQKINDIAKGAADSLRDRMKGDGGIAVFSPEYAWCRGYNSEEVSDINRLVIHRSDFLIAILTPECFGTIREIEYAQTVAEIPVVVITDSAVELTKHIESAGLFITQMESVLSHPVMWADGVIKEVRRVNDD